MKGRRAEVDRPAPVLAPAPGHEGQAAGSSDSAYSSIEFGAVWEMVSLACFALALSLHYLPDWLVPLPDTPFNRFFLPILAVSGLALIGILFGWIGKRRSRRPGLARIGIFLNSIVLGLIGLLILVLYLLRYR